MKKYIKIILSGLLCVTAAASVVVGLKIYSAHKTPEKAFEKNKVSQEIKPDLILPLETEKIETELEPSQQISDTPLDTPQIEESSQKANIENFHTPEQKTSSKKINQNIIAIAILGIDTSSVREQQNMGWRSDSMIVVAIDSEKKSATAITIPRDTRATIGILNKKGKLVSEKVDKINSAYSYGGGKLKQSNENTLNALSNLLGVDLKYYASIDMDSIIPLCDAVGGIDVLLEDNIKGVGKKGELVTLDGEKAYIYLRQRKTIGDGSDLYRTKRQQTFLKSLAAKIKNENPLSLVPSVLKTLGSDLKTNLNFDQILSLAKILSTLEENSIKFETIPGSTQTIKKTSWYIPNSKKMQKLVEKIFYE